MEAERKRLGHKLKRPLTSSFEKLLSGRPSLIDIMVHFFTSRLAGAKPTWLHGYRGHAKVQKHFTKGSLV